MQFRIANSFTKALGKLNSQQQSAAKITVFDLQQNPSAPGLQFHRIDKAKDAHFWSVRCNDDIRVIIHKTEASFLVCYVAHHDDAYKWAERRRIETHTKTGAVQLVEIRERVQEITVPVYLTEQPAMVQDSRQKKYQFPVFRNLSEDDLLDVGVPPDWIADVQQTTEDTFFTLMDHIPEEATEALFQYMVIGTLHKPDKIGAGTSPFDHPDAQRRFRVMDDAGELQLALEYGWDEWVIFLHPSQRRVVERELRGPTRVSGSAGTGKTVVALHRAGAIVKQDRQAKTLLTTFSQPLATMLEYKLAMLIGRGDGASNVTILPLFDVASQLFTLAFGDAPRPATPEQIETALATAGQEFASTIDFTARLIASEWHHVVDAWQLETQEAYYDIPRLGRKHRMGAKQRARIWPIFARTRELLAARGLLSWPEIYRQVTGYFAQSDDKPFSHIIVDEAQDLGVPELRMLAAIADRRPDALFFAGDIGQRIFQKPFSWKALGIDIRGRSDVLKVNYRTSHQIRRATDGLLPSTIRDMDGNEEDRKGTISAFTGPEPEVRTFADTKQEIEAVALWVYESIDEGIQPDEIGIFVRSDNELARAFAVVEQIDHVAVLLSDGAEERAGRVSVGTMHSAKGLEFKVVVVMACDDDVLPWQERIEAAADERELDELYETERHLFYVACTRARDLLWVSGVMPASEFFVDLT